MIDLFSSFGIASKGFSIPPLAEILRPVSLEAARKSNAVYTAWNKTKKDAQSSVSLLPPKHILNAPTALMKQQGYGQGYVCDYDTFQAFSGQNYFPETVNPQNYYQPVERGFERKIRKRLDYWNTPRNNTTAKEISYDPA